MLNEIDLSRADLNLLVLFDVVMAERNVGRTAEQLHLSPSAVSHGLGRLRRLFNDPLFLRTPKGVAPTTRATELAVPIADILARVKSVMSIAEPFDPVTSSRRFMIGAPDGVSAIFLTPLLTELNKAAPKIDLGVRQLLPTEGESSPDRAWRTAFTDLDARVMDIAILPTDDIAARFLSKTLYEEEFVVATRAGHPFAVDPTLERYCEMQHLVVSQTGDPFGFVDRILSEKGLKRRIALTVPNFMLALAILAETDLISALPKRFVAMHAQRFKVVGTEAPLSLGRFRLNAVAPKVAMMDLGLVWLFDMLERVGRASTTRNKGLSPSKRRS
ncbi:MAG: LysR family transcriptional regulator [Cyanobacteria bacterium RU_5_0]|nr:LysR family transcriptional regulator [Cyanobacteria bacterium RU_5_0]